MERRSTYAELLNSDSFKPTYFDRTVALLRNSILMLQLCHIGMFDFEQYNQREMIERRQTDLLRIIANASAMAVIQLKADTDTLPFKTPSSGNA